MPSRVEEQILRIVPTVDSKAMQSGMKKAMDVMSKQTSRATKVYQALNKVYKKGADSMKKWSTDSKVRAAVEISATRELLDLTKQLTKAEEDLEHATDAEAQLIKADMAVWEKSFKDRIRNAKDFTKTMLAAQKATKELHDEEENRKATKIAEKVGYSGTKMGEDLAENFGEALSAIPSRDLMGFAKHLVGGVTSVGKGIQGKGLRMQASAMGGGGGKGMAAMGAVMNKVGGTLAMFSKMGPILSAFSGALMAVVKVFLDADAAAKDFNKSVLETTGTAGYLAKNFGSAKAAAMDLDGTMKDMYAQATSLDNLRWGISKETHSAVESALGAEGVQLEKVADYFQDIKKGSAEATGYVKDWGSMVQMSVGFSRAFGVSLSDITSFQGEMMTEMGQNFDQVQASFQTMLDGAQEAGIGTNKFFAQMRAMSTDLGMFNLRMEDATKLMGKLDKVMNPRKAQEFFQHITGFMKGMGLMDRTKMTLLVGKGKSKDILQKDLASRISGLSEDLKAKGIGITPEEMKKILGNRGEMAKWMAKNDKKLDANTRDYMLTAAMQQGKLTKGGLVDIASAMKDGSPLAAMKMLDGVAQKFFKKPVDELTDVQKLAFEQMTGFNDEQQDQMSKFKSALDLSKDTIAEKIEDGTALTQEEANMLAKMHIGQKGKDQADKLRAADSEDVFNNMNKTQQDALRESAGTLDLAKEQGKMTQSIVDKLGVIMDFLMGKLYTIFGSIWDSILDVVDALPGTGSGDQRKLDKIQAQAIRDGARDIAEAASSSKNLGDFKKAIFEGAGKTMEKGLADLNQQIAANRSEEKDLQTKLSQAQSDEEKQGLESQLAANNKTRDALQTKMNKVTDAIETQAKGGNNNKGRLAVQTYTAATRAGLSEDTAKKLYTAMAKDKSKGLGVAMDDLGLSLEDQAKVLDKLRLDLSPEQLAKATADANQALGVGGTAPAPGVASPAQVAAAPSSATPATASDMQDATEQQGKDVQGATDDLRLKLKQQSSGVVLNSSYLKNQYGGQIEDSVYNAASKALFEYWMYQSGTKDDAIKALQAGVNPRDMGASFAAEMKKGTGAGDAFKNIANARAAQGNAAGGVVGRPAPGEFMASVKPGETIVPAGGAKGGVQKVVIELKGDMLKQIMRATAMNTLNDHDHARARR